VARQGRALLVAASGWASSILPDLDEAWVDEPHCPRRRSGEVVNPHLASHRQGCQPAKRKKKKRKEKKRKEKN